MSLSLSVSVCVCVRARAYHTHTVCTYFLKHMQYKAVDMVGVFARMYMFRHIARGWR